MRIGVPKETAPGETRVALVPESVERLRKKGVEVTVEAGAGEHAGYADADYAASGAAVAAEPVRSFAADVVLKVQRPGATRAGGGHEADLLREGGVLIGFLQPDADADLLRRLVERRVTAFALERLPRISRAQNMDALSSMSTVAGYKAVLLGAAALPRFFPLLMTAAGTIAPARVLVVGAGVAGLQAIATARRLGAVVDAFDVRAQVQEQVQSLGAHFVAMPEPASLEGGGGYARQAGEEELRREREALREPLKQADVVVTTAMVPGRKAPLLLTAEMVGTMKPGSVIVDLAAESGGNCELTVPGGEAVHRGVRVMGEVNLAATLPYHASRMYSRNLIALLDLMVKDGALRLDWSDEILDKSCVAHEGRARMGGTGVAAVGAWPAGGGPS